VSDIQEEKRDDDSPGLKSNITLTRKLSSKIQLRATSPEQRERAPSGSANVAQIKIVINQGFTDDSIKSASAKKMTLDYLLGKSSRRRNQLQTLINSIRSTSGYVIGDKLKSTSIYAYKVYRYLCANCAKIF